MKKHLPIFSQVRMLLFWLLAFASLSVLAQENTLTGKVLDGTGEPLPGVTILVQGTSTGTITDIEGNYSIKVPNDANIEFSFVGFLDQVVNVNGRTKIDITLEEDIVTMAEVVVVGYGTVDKKDLTGSVGVLSAEDMALQPVVRLEAALQSKIPGVVVNQNSGNPGSGMKVRVRGTNSFGGSNDPLYVIDGFIGADIQSINPNDIQAMSVLKDASATALYGSQGANGVILITTKGGKEKDAQINVSYQHGVSQLRTRWELMEGWQYMQTINDKLTAGGTPEANLLFSRRDILEAQSFGLGTDWQDQVFQTGIQDQIQLSATKGNLFFSSAAQWNTGIVTGTKYNRYNLRVNYTENIFKPVKLFIGLSNAFEDRQNGDDAEHIQVIRTAVGWAPNLPVYDTLTGDYTRNPSYGPLQANPVYTLRESPSRVLRNDLLTNIYLEFDLMKGLKFKTQGALNLLGRSATNFTRVAPNAVASNPLNSSYGNNHQMTFKWQSTQQLTYKKVIGEHAFDATAIYEARSTVFREFGASGDQLSTTDLGYYSAPVAAVQRNSNGRENTELWSYFSRVNYTLKDKYLFTFNVRHDESSRLGDGYEGATFYGGALAYRISEEPFMKSVKFIEELKLRFSAGQVGSQAVGFLATIETVGYGKGYSFDGASFDRGASIPQPKNAKLTWETTNQLDAGFDMSVDKGRFNVNFDVFYKLTTGLIFDQQLPAYVGGGIIKVNAGEMENKGLEFAVSGFAIDRKDFSVDFNANVSLIRNRLMDIAGSSDFIASGKNQRDNPDLLDNSHRNFVGRPLGLLWGLVYDGVYSTDQEELANQYNRSPGDPIYRDIDGNGQIDNSDMTVIGNPNPDYVWGLTTNVRYKNFTLNMVWNGVHGVDALNSVKYSTYGGQRDATNVDILKRWTPENQDTDIPGFTSTSVLYRQSSQWIEDASYIKLRNVALKYDVPVKSVYWLKGVTALSFSVTAQNVLVLTQYSGYDPESLSDNGDRAGGFDEGGYPIPRTILTGVNLKF